MFVEGSLYDLFFIALNLQGKIIIGLTKKLVASYMVGNLVLEIQRLDSILFFFSFIFSLLFSFLLFYF